MRPQPPVVAYFSMEIAVAPRLPSYAGGLGVLAGDMLRAAADLRMPIVGVTLLHRAGYFRQTLSDDGNQLESPELFDVEAVLTPVEGRASVEIEGRRVQIRAWRYGVAGERGGVVPVLFLDTDVPENSPQDRAISRSLYGGDAAYRLAQEIVLGVGGVRVLRATGFSRVSCYHLNEGHSALLTAELLREEMQAAEGPRRLEESIAQVRSRCVFTTHTPIAAGHDRFDGALAAKLVPRGLLEPSPLFIKNGMLDLTHTAVGLSRSVNGVSRRHAEVCREMFPGVQVQALTNGVHPATWVCPAMAELYERACPGWKQESQQLRLALAIDHGEFLAARARAKSALIERVKSLVGTSLDPSSLTIGIARRATGYKRLDLILRNLPRLASIASSSGGLQLVFAGKAHPNDGTGHDVIRRINEISRTRGAEVRIVYLPGYDMDLAASIVSGVDVWLNTPIAPLEASGTSGMKAALNGVPSLSVLDGWWVEGCIEGVTGWAVGTGIAGGGDEADERDSNSLYDKLENRILPIYHGSRIEWARVGQHAIAVNGAYFNTHRLMREYAETVYRQL